jgi:hypothetical protein
MRRENDALRVRSERLREHSRELRERSQQCRRRLTQAAERIDEASASLAVDRESDGATRHRQRLVRAEIDLEAAIGECSAALAQVRRELRWTDTGPSPIVH